MKKLWKSPQLDVLDVRMTMNGPGKANPDCFDVGDGNGHAEPSPTSNASCLKPAGGGGDSQFDS